MSATIYARQVKPCEGEPLSTGSPSWFIGTMERAFGYNFPIMLDESHITKLEGMAATIDRERDNPYHELIDLIGKWKVVEVYAEY